MAFSTVLSDRSANGIATARYPQEITADTLVLSHGPVFQGGTTQRMQLDMKFGGVTSPLAVTFPWVRSTCGFHNTAAQRSTRGRPATVLDITPHPEIRNMFNTVQAFVEAQLGPIEWTTPPYRTNNTTSPPIVTMWTPVFATSQRVITGCVNEEPNSIWTTLDLAELNTWAVESVRIRPIIVIKGCVVQEQDGKLQAYWSLGVDTFLLGEITWKGLQAAKAAPKTVFGSARDFWNAVRKDEPKAPAAPNAARPLIFPPPRVVAAAADGVAAGAAEAAAEAGAEAAFGDAAVEGALASPPPRPASPQIPQPPAQQQQQPEADVDAERIAPVPAAAAAAAAADAALWPPGAVAVAVPWAQGFGRGIGGRAGAMAAAAALGAPQRAGAGGGRFAQRRQMQPAGR
jgi:hypothetical protein